MRETKRTSQGNISTTTCLEFEHVISDCYTAEEPSSVRVCSALLTRCSLHNAQLNFCTLVPISMPSAQLMYVQSRSTLQPSCAMALAPAIKQSSHVAVWHKSVVSQAQT
eukprot:3564651-Amphidinium_carterae.1